MVQREINSELLEENANAVCLQTSPTHISADYNILREKIEKNNSLSSIRAYVSEKGLGNGFHADQALILAIATYKRPHTLVGGIHHQLLSSLGAKENFLWKGRYELLSFLIKCGFDFTPDLNQINLIGKAMNELSFWGVDSEFLLKFIQKSKSLGIRFEDTSSNTPVTSLCLLMRRYYKMLTNTHPGQLFNSTSPEKAQSKIKKHFSEIVTFVDSINEKNLNIIADYSDALYESVSDKLVDASGKALASIPKTLQNANSGP